jgi:glycosyltransferase involved in cell wall biosynthesis
MINCDVVVVGPLDGPNTGQQFMTKYLITLVSKKIMIISTGGIKSSKLKLLFNLIKGFIKLISICLFNKNRFIVYLSISRSWAGVAKESYISLLHLLFKFPLVVHWHGAEPLFWVQQKNPILSRLFIKLWSGAALHIALTSRMAKDLQMLGFNKTSVVRNFPNINEKNFEKIYIKQKIKTIKFLFFSNIIEGKGLEDAIYSLNLITEKNFTLDILGSNDSSSCLRYKKLIDSCDFAKYHGCLEGDKKENLLKSCDILIFPSTYRTEALPLVVIEAIFAGLVVVAYNHNYMSEFEDIPGVFLTEPNPDELIKVLNSLCLNTNLIQNLKKKNRNFRKIYSKKVFDCSISNLLNHLVQ